MFWLARHKSLEEETLVTVVDSARYFWKYYTINLESSDDVFNGTLFVIIFHQTT